ncbi:MAG: hypothetical protein K9J13_16155 [Saprospiraceae bacterium]|nr:hypothetical protein [Saprospiraceae bacterium]
MMSELITDKIVAKDLDGNQYHIEEHIVYEELLELELGKFKRKYTPVKIEYFLKDEFAYVTKVTEGYYCIKRELFDPNPVFVTRILDLVV